MAKVRRVWDLQRTKQKMKEGGGGGAPCPLNRSQSIFKVEDLHGVSNQ